MKKWKQLGILILSFTLLFSGSGCGKKTNTNNKKTLDKDHVYKETDLTDLLKNIQMTDIQQCIYKNGRLYFKGSSYDEASSLYDDCRFASINLNGSDGKYFSLMAPTAEENNSESTKNSMDETSSNAIEDSASDSEEEVVSDSSKTEYTSYINMNITSDGHFLLLKNCYSDYYEGDEWISENHYSIEEYDVDGNLVKKQTLEPDSSVDASSYSISEFVLMDNGTMCFVENNTQIVVMDSNYQRITTLSLGDNLNCLYVHGNKVYATAWDDSYEHQYIYEYLENQKQFSEGAPFALSGTLLPGNDAYDFFISTDKEIYGWNVGDEEATEILDFIDSDANVSFVNSLISTSENEFVIFYINATDYNNSLSKFTKVDPENVKEKQVISLGCLYLDYDVKKNIISFNKENDSYRIQVMDYSIYNSDNDYYAGMTRMNNDIASGKIPDIFIISDGIPVDSYIEKGLFADLTPFIEKEEGLSMDQLAPNVVKAFSKDGKYYSLVPSFYIQTYVAKESIVGSKQNWSISDAKNVLAKLPEGCHLFDQKTKSSALNEGLLYMSKSFIDWKNGSCKYDSDEFVQLLEFANQFPKESDLTEEEEESYWSSWDSLYRENKLVMLDMYMTSISDVNYADKGRIGEKVTFVGFPTVNGTGSYLIPTLQLTMSSQSNVKDGAWEFMKYYLSDEYQSSTDLYGFPVRLDQLQTQVEKAQQKPFYYDDDGNKVEYNETYSIGDQDIEIEPMTEERAKEVYDFVLSVDCTASLNSSIQSLVEEEADAYFSGQKSAQSVAQIIQSRVQIYVNEQQ